MNIDKSLLSGSYGMMILSLLKEREKYGYQMINELALRSDDTFKMKEGTLYPILHSMEKQGYVESFEKKTDGGRVRRYYRITKKGLKALEEKKAMWKEYSSKVNAVMEPKPLESRG